MCYTNTHTHMCMYVIELNYDWRRIYVYVDIFRNNYYTKKLSTTVETITNFKLIIESYILKSVQNLWNY